MGKSEETLATKTKPCRYGTMTFYEIDAPIGAALERYGEWSQKEIEFLSTLIRPGDVVVDAGANIGTHALAFAEFVGDSGHVHAFEAHPEIAVLLSKNVRDNNLDSIVSVHSIGLGDSKRSATVMPLSRTRRQNTGECRVYFESPDAESIEIPVRPLQECVPGRVDVIKMDVEGSEVEVLNGSLELIRQYNPVIFSECNSIEEGWKTVKILRSFGYDCFFQSFEAFNSESFSGAIINIFGHAHESNLLFIHPDSDRVTSFPGTRVSSLDQFAKEFLKVPRYGDSTQFQRDPERLNEEIDRGKRKLHVQKSIATRLTGRLNRLSFHLAKMLSLDSWQGSREQRIAEGHYMGFEQDLEDLRASGLFDEEWYREQVNDSRLESMGALEHYYFFGAENKLSPNRSFDGRYYLENYPDVFESGINPLLHYIRTGEKEARSTQQFAPGAYSDATEKAPSPVAPSEKVLEKLAAESKRKDEADIDIIIPVYKGYDDTLACIYSVLTSPNKCRWNLIVINDCSPDELLSEKLRELSRQGLFTLLENEENLGFVQTANKGMSQNVDRDVLLLNSDTIVYSDWLDRMLQHARNNPDAATITPLSNNATICSYPHPNVDNPQPLEVDFEEVDRYTASWNKGNIQDLPSGVGFCFYIRRKCLDEIGMFDAALFGKGYSEENDFCQRAVAAGWRNIAAGDVFVRHTGRISFGADGLTKQREALEKLTAKYPEYLSSVGRFIRNDGLLLIRRNLDLARLAAQVGPRTMLFVTHIWGGGIERCVRDMAARLQEEGIGVVTLRPSGLREKYVQLNSIENLDLPSLSRFHLLENGEELVQLLSRLGIINIHVHSLAGFEMHALQIIPELAQALSVSYDYTFHDYIPICPRAHLYDERNLYCGEKGMEVCKTCLKRNGSTFGSVDITTWRRDWGQFISGARLLGTPSEDAMKRLKGYFPDDLIHVRPYLEPLIDFDKIPQPSERSQDEPLNIALFGALGPHKGSHQLLACARHAHENGLPLKFTVIGYTNIQDLKNLPNVTVTGQYYSESEAIQLAAAHKCHVALYLSVWPETYAYTVSLSIEAGLYPVVFDIGAPAERLKRFAWGEVLPLGRINDAAWINDALLSMKIRPVPKSVVSMFNTVKYHNLVKDYYNLE